MSGPKYSLARNKSGYWEIRWTERDEGAGRSRSRSQSCGTKSKREAEAFRDQWLAAREVIAASQTGHDVGSIIDLYLQRHAAQENASETQRWSLRPVREWFDGYDVGHITDDELSAYKAHRLADVSSGTVRKELSALRAALNWAASPKRKPRIIMPEDVPHIDLPPDGAPRTNFLSEGENARLFALAKARAMDPDLPFTQRRVGLFICLALETAARQGAILGLTWNRVHLDARRQIEYRDPEARVTNKRRVPVPISAELMPVLLDAYARRDVGNPFVLGHQGSIYKTFKRFVRGHGFAGLTIHDMRRTWATLRVMWGARVEEVAAVLGDTVEMTEKHYAHFQPGYGRGAVDLRPAASVAVDIAAE